MTTRLFASVTAAPKPVRTPRPAKAPAIKKPAPIKRARAKEIGRGKPRPAFSPNPGALELHTYVPSGLKGGAPLVVLLHGCGQDAESFAVETGWRALADRCGLVLLMPAQTEANNAQRCFNWFRPGDTGRDLGEAGSIVAMVRSVIKARRCDPARVFVTGLSAGAAMTSCLLAAYPDLFAGGGVVAGLPAGSASGVVGAMTRMSGRGADLSAHDWMGRARALAPVGYAGPWPRLSIWHGDADTVVAPVNGGQLAVQWAMLAGLPDPVSQTVKPGVQKQSWGDPARPALEFFRIEGMGHVYPAGAGAPLKAAAEIARFWGVS